MSETENIGTGRKITRDEFGRFKSVELSSEVASKMGKARWSGESSAERLLAEQGYDRDNPPLEYIRIMASQALKFPAAMSHWRRVHALSDQTSEDAGLEKPQLGEQCQLCGQISLRGYDGHGLGELVMMIRAADVIEEGQTSEAEATGSGDVAA